MNKENNKAGIIISTMNRPEFVIRQLEYYAEVGCPHPIYIADSSSQKDFDKVQKKIAQLKDKIRIVHKEYPPGPGHIEFLLNLVEERYVCFNGDDDYQIPDCLTRCAEFLDQHPDYATACGYAVNFKLKQNGPYGELSWLKEYPRPQFTTNDTTTRFIEYFSNYFVPNISVNRTEQMRKNFERASEIPDIQFATEILPCALSIIEGKAKTFDCLGIVRQMHDLQYAPPSYFNWIASKEWFDLYSKYREIVAQKLASKAYIPHSEAEKKVDQGFWIFLQKNLKREYPEFFPEAVRQKSNSKTKSLRHFVATLMPFLKTAYRSYWLPIIYNKKQLHYEVLRPKSKYYKDFKPVMDSFTSSARDHDY